MTHDVAKFLPDAGQDKIINQVRRKPYVRF
jgi:hypothetical protein